MLTRKNTQDQCKSNFLLLRKNTIQDVQKLLHPITNEIFMTKVQEICIKSIVLNYPIKDIAKNLNVSERTIKNYLSQIKESLHVNSRKEMIEKILSVEHNKSVIFNF